jgi:hypothetical protein
VDAIISGIAIGLGLIGVYVVLRLIHHAAAEARGQQSRDSVKAKALMVVFAIIATLAGIGAKAFETFHPAAVDVIVDSYEYKPLAPTYRPPSSIDYRPYYRSTRP